MTSPAASASRWIVGADVVPGERTLAEELPVAVSVGDGAAAVLLATPADLEDLALGFCVTEGLVAPQSAPVETSESPLGVELRVLAPAIASPRDRALVGTTGCGLCGVRALADAARPLPVLSGGPSVSAAALRAALGALSAQQPLSRATRAVHAAAWYVPSDAAPRCVREDVGRHNAVDKLVGALVRQGVAPADGVLLLTSRVSVELVQKAAAFGARVIAAISAPTGLAVRCAHEAGITLLAVVREDSAEVFTHPGRVEELA